MRKYKVHMLLYVAFFAVWVLMTRGAVSPLIYPDEAGYIGWAREFAGLNGEHWRYFPGYGLLLSPIFWFTNDLLKVYPVIILLNCLMGAAIPVLLYSIAGNFIKGKERLLCAVAVSLYPAWMMYGNLALSEVFLTFSYTLLLWSICQWGKRGWSWILSFLCCVWMIASHGRCGSVILGVLAAFCVFVWKKPWRKRALFICAGVLIAVLIGSVIYLSQTESINGAHLWEQLMGLFSLKGLWNSVSTLLSQSYYLMLSTFCLAALGIWQGIKIVKKEKNPAVWFVLITFLCSLCLSAIFMNHHEKPDHILYGRYNEFVLGGILLLGMISLWKKEKTSWILWLFLGLALFTGLRYGKDLAGIDSNLCHTWGLYFYKILFSRFTFWGVTVWFAFGAGMLYWIGHRNSRSALLFLCALFLVTSLYTKYDYFVKGAKPRYQPSQIVDLVEERVALQPLEGDTMGYPWGVYHLLTLNPEIVADDTAELLLTTKPMGEIVASETYDTLYLCKKKSTKQPLSGTVKVSDWNEKGLTLSVTNTGAPWLCYQGAESLEDCVRLVGWIISDGEEEQFRVDLPGNLYQGQSMTVEVPLSLQDGTHQVQISPSVDLSEVITSVFVSVTVKNGNIIRCESIQGQSGSFDLLEGEGYPRQTKGMFRGYSTGYTIYDNLGWNTDAKSLILYTEGQAKNLSVSVNGTDLPLTKQDGNRYSFDLKGMTEMNRIEIKSETTVPAKEAGIPNWLGFLRSDSPCKLVSFFVRGMDKVFGVPVDFCPYGVGIDRIKVGEGL